VLNNLEAVLINLEEVAVSTAHAGSTGHIVVARAD
jgi:hypothetical protein